MGTEAPRPLSPVLTTALLCCAPAIITGQLALSVCVIKAWEPAVSCFRAQDEVWRSWKTSSAFALSCIFLERLSWRLVSARRRPPLDGGFGSLQILFSAHTCNRLARLFESVFIKSPGQASCLSTPVITSD